MEHTRARIEIDEELCDGCGLCVPSCEEGALRIIDGKARLISDALCDGLGACLGECPRGALKLVSRNGGRAEAGRAGPPEVEEGPARSGPDPPSLLRQWPVQIRLVSPRAPFLSGAHLVVAADCVPVAVPEFQRRFVSGRAVMIGCPKFDDLHQYAQRFARIFAESAVARVTVVVMEVPCCRSLPLAVWRGLKAAGKEIPVREIVISLDGRVMQEDPPRTTAACRPQEGVAPGDLPR